MGQASPWGSHSANFISCISKSNGYKLVKDYPLGQIAMVATSIPLSNPAEVTSIEAYLLAPPDGMEWVEGQLSEKNGMTAKHGRTQSRLDYAWRDYMKATNQGGEVYTETPCRTLAQVRRPDVAYLTPEQGAQFGDFTVLPQSFPLVAEIVSPTDYFEDIFTKVSGYLHSGCQEVWLIAPESQWIVVITQQQRVVFRSGEVAKTQLILPGFSLKVDDLLT